MTHLRTLALPPAPCCLCGTYCRCPGGMRVEPLSRRDDQAVRLADERRAAAQAADRAMRRIKR